MRSRKTIIFVAAFMLLFQFLPAAAHPVAAAAPCDWVQFIADVTVPDHTTYAPGTAFTKTWQLKNIGTCPWKKDTYAAVFASGDQMGAPGVVPLTADVVPGATVNITVNMTAPSAPGHYVGNWEMRNATGGLFGSGPHANGIFFVDINVTASYTTAYDFVASVTSATWKSGAGPLIFPVADGAATGYAYKADTPQLETGATDSSAGLMVGPQAVAGGYIQAVYPAFTVQAGDRFQSIVNCNYTAFGCYVNFRLNYQIGSGAVNTFWSFNERYDGLFYRANLDLSSLAGQNVTFILYMADVSGHGTPTGDKALWGETKIVRVTGGGTPPPPPISSTCDKGAFISDVTIPDGTIETAGSSFTKTWRIQNVGSCPWAKDTYALVFTFGDLLGASPVIPLTSSVAPNDTVNLSVPMVAPTAAGHYRSYWRLRNASGAQFGVGTGMITFFADINVTSSSTTAYDFVANANLATWTSGAGPLIFPVTDNAASGFVFSLSAPELEDGSTGAAGLLTAPQNVTDGYIQGIYPAFAVQSGDRFQSIINCQFGATGCYVTFQLNYQIGTGAVQTLKSFREKIDGMYYGLDVPLTSLAGQNVKFILKVLATGSPTGDRAVWSGPRIARGGSGTSATVTVYFLDQNKYISGPEPYETAVTRPASSVQSDPLTVLTQLFLGPTPAEYALGLRLVASGTTGYSLLTIDGGVARVYLTGTCNSGGATYTIGNLLRKNLKQFATIQYVKVYDQAGATETPTGNSDSIPACLEP